MNYIFENLTAVIVCSLLTLQFILKIRWSIIMSRIEIFKNKYNFFQIFFMEYSLIVYYLKYHKIDDIYKIATEKSTNYSKFPLVIIFLYLLWVNFYG